MSTRRVPLVGAGTPDDLVRPNLPAGVGYGIVEHHDDGTVTVQVDDPGEGDALRVATRLTVVDKVKADALTDDAVIAIAPLFPPWEPGIDVEAGWVYRWDGTLVEVIQAHTTQSDWSPDVVPALFKVHRTPDMTEWVAGISVNVGEQFTHLGTTYQVVQAHTTQVGWEPPNVPSLWSVV